MNLNIEYEQEEDGRLLAEVIGLPGVLAYGNTPDEAMVKADVLVLRLSAEKLEQEENRPQSITISCVAA
ncbi:MAG: type II toxin-antitoxin system HicB family antitoxin [Candidatus Competibacteraceae bacterium]